MPPKKKSPEEIADAAWAAGVIDMGGSLSLIKSGNTRVVRYTLTSGMFPKAVERMATYGGSNTATLPASKTTRPAKRFTCQGAALHSLMTRVWDYLSIERKKQYADLRKQITTTLEGPNPYTND